MKTAIKSPKVIQVVAPGSASSSRAEPGTAARRASPRALLLAPHRLAFFAGTAMLVVVSLWWTLLLAAPYLGAQIVTPLPPTLVHGFTFASSFMPLFMIGFMFTAGPRWLDVEAPDARSLRWPVVLHVSGVALLTIGTETGSGLTAFGALLLAIAWTAAGVAFAGLIRSSRARDRLHACCVMGFWIVGIASALLFTAGLAIHHYGLVAASAWTMVFGFAAPIYATVAHRVLPFFTSNVVTEIVPWRPNWVLAVLLSAIVVFGLIQLGGRADLIGQRHGAWLTLAFVGPAAVALAWLAVRWGLLQSLRGRSLRLLAMLHLGFVWAALALLLAVIDALGVLLPDDAIRLGSAPLHALTMGFLGGMLFAMATRVICGHGGIVLVADDFVWTLFWLLQVATLLRLAGPLWPAATGWMTASAAVVWSIVWVTWAVRFLPVLLKPRVDGRPG
jgi:uncharacterized protein involved in response to NO